MPIINCSMLITPYLGHIVDAGRNGTILFDMKVAMLLSLEDAPKVFVSIVTLVKASGVGRRGSAGREGSSASSPHPISGLNASFSVSSEVPSYLAIVSGCDAGE